MQSALSVVVWIPIRIQIQIKVPCERGVIVQVYVRVTSRNRTLARFDDFDFSPSAANTTPSVPFYKVSELCALA